MKWFAIIFSSLFLSAPLIAQEESGENDGDKDKAEAVKVAQANGKKASEKQEAGESDADDYKPSEEVSEDLTVSYPVDI